MKYRLMDLLACPICKHFPLELHVFAKGEVSQKVKAEKCEGFCGYEGKPIPQLESLKCEACSTMEIIEGILVCPSCKRWYPIEEEIPRLLPDELREKEDLDFLRRHEDEVPKEILESGKPFNLREVS